MNIEVLWDGTYGLSSLSEKTRKSNHLQMTLQRQHFLLSYLKTLSVVSQQYFYSHCATWLKFQSAIQDTSSECMW